MGCQGLELHYLQKPNMDSIGFDPQLIFGIRADTCQILKTTKAHLGDQRGGFTPENLFLVVFDKIGIMGSDGTSSQQRCQG